MVLKVITILRPSSPFHTKSFVLLGMKIACWLKPYHRKSNSALILVSKKLYIAIRFTATNTIASLFSYGSGFINLEQISIQPYS